MVETNEGGSRIMGIDYTRKITASLNVQPPRGSGAAITRAIHQSGRCASDPAVADMKQRWLASKPRLQLAHSFVCTASDEFSEYGRRWCFESLSVRSQGALECCSATSFGERLLGHRPSQSPKKDFAQFS